MTCMELNNYVLGVAAAAVVGNIFWFFMWAALKGRYKNLVADMGVEQ